MKTRPKIPRTKLGKRSGRFQPKTRKEWLRMGLAIGELANASLFWLGDWLAQGIRQFGDSACFEDVAKSDCLESLPVNGALCVALRLTPAQRREFLSWRHHLEAARMPSDTLALLEEAERRQWTATEVKAQILRLKHARQP